MRLARGAVGAAAVLLILGVLAQTVPAREDRNAHPAQVRQRPAETALRPALSGGPALSSSPEIRMNFDLVGHVNLGHETKGDVWLYDHGGETGKFAYVGSWSAPCNGRGVYVVDVNDPSKPKKVALAHTKDRAVSYEDPVVVRIGERDVLGVGIQQCGRGGRPGLVLFDVTNPDKPKKLSFFDAGTLGAHEIDMVVRPDGTALAALALPYASFEDPNAMTIVDISDPANPVEASTWVIEDSTLPVPANSDPAAEPRPEISNCCQGLGYFPDFFFHSVRFADDGSTIYGILWDAGVLKFDITDPTNPLLEGRTVYPFDADGEGHSMTPYDVEGKRYILQNDEDFFPQSPAHILSSATGETRFATIEEFWMPTVLSDVGTVEASLHDAGDGCEDEDFVDAAGRIVLIDVFIDLQEQPCKPHVLIINAAQAGASAIILNFDGVFPGIFGEIRPIYFFSPSPKGLAKINKKAEGVPVVAIGAMDGLADTLRSAAGGPSSVTVTLEPQEPSWGFLRIFDETAGEDLDNDGVVEWEQVGEFSDLPHVHEYPPPKHGFWSIHNTEVSGDRAYASWYSHGIVALDMTDPVNPVMVGQYAPKSPKGESVEVWGVDIDPDSGMIYASDILSGLWILQPTGPAVPTGP
jgi:hypothetical protein